MNYGLFLKQFYREISSIILRTVHENFFLKSHRNMLEQNILTYSKIVVVYEHKNLG